MTDDNRRKLTGLLTQTKFHETDLHVTGRTSSVSNKGLINNNTMNARS